MGPWGPGLRVWLWDFKKLTLAAVCFKNFSQRDSFHVLAHKPASESLYWSCSQGHGSTRNTSYVCSVACPCCVAVHNASAKRFSLTGCFTADSGPPVGATWALVLHECPLSSSSAGSFPCHLELNEGVRAGGLLWLLPVSG